MRTLSTLLLILVLAVQSLAYRAHPHAHLAVESTPDEELSPAEEREARELVARFIEGFAEKKDLGVLIDELFVTDFTRRLAEQNRQDPFIHQRAAPFEVSPSELRDYFIAILNVWSLTWLLLDAHRCSEAFDEKNADGVQLKDIFPDAVLVLVKSEPLLVRFYRRGMDMKIEPEESDAVKDESFSFADAVEVARLAMLLDKAASLMREHLARVEGEKREGCSPAKDRADTAKLSVGSVGAPLFGEESGTRIISVKLSRLHLDLVREAGRLRILSAIPYLD